MLGLVFSLTTALSKQIYLVERLGAPERRGKAKDAATTQHLKAVVFVRPTEQSVQTLCQCLARPKYREYHICKFVSTKLCSHCDLFCISFFQSFIRRFSENTCGGRWAQRRDASPGLEMSPISSTILANTDSQVMWMCIGVLRGLSCPGPECLISGPLPDHSTAQVHYMDDEANANIIFATYIPGTCAQPPQELGVPTAPGLQPITSPAKASTTLFV